MRLTSAGVRRVSVGRAARRLLVTAGAALICVANQAGPLLAQQFAPVRRADFVEIAAQGFGDRQNSFAWSMAWFQGKLYVGTMRSYLCAYAAAIHAVFPPSAYPPVDPDVECPPDPADLSFGAEIWSWAPTTGAWTLVFHSPDTLQIPGTDRFTARDVGFRGMHVFREPDGTEALYVGGCSSKFMHATLPGGRLLRSTDGVTFAPVPQDPGTFLGDLGNACFRGIETHNGRMYMIAGSFLGEGSVIESADPGSGNDGFRQITPAGADAYEIASFNGYLYVTFDDPRGFALYRIGTAGDLPYPVTPIFIRGGYKEPNGNPSALSMKVFKGSLYVGANSARVISEVLCVIDITCAAILANGGAELFRVHPDDSWDLVVGQSRATPDGFKPALSGINPGFGWLLNQHLWRMEVFDGRLYVGTYDVATELRHGGNGVGDAVAPWQGFDLWYSTDGERFVPIDVKGFGDPFGYGVRSLKATPAGLFLGTANPFYGLRVYRGIPR